jgi:hypothetical protein
MSRLVSAIPVLLALAVAAPLPATITAQLTSSVAQPQLVGTSVTWTATASDTNAGALDFQFSVELASNGFQVLQDYDVSNVFSWTPYVQEGKYQIQVIARNLTTNQTVTVTEPFGIKSRVTGSTPVISTTNNPLVALYSAPACASGSSMYVKYITGTVANQTNTVACASNHSMNFYIGGLYPASTYTANYVLVTGSGSTNGPSGQFTTGAIPTTVPFPALSIPMKANSQTSLSQSVLLLDSYSNAANGNNQNFVPFATDLHGHVIWYYGGYANSQNYGSYFIRPVPGGTFLLYSFSETAPIVRQQLFREIDMAGNTIRQTSITRLNQELAALGKLGVTGFNHDAERLPNGHTLVKASQEEIFPAGTQGSTAPVDILGDCIMDLDTNMQIDWSWSAFDYLNINEVAPLGEICKASDTNCPPLMLAPVANDWTHGNSLYYIPSNGDILFSMRDLDQVIKIDFNNGVGTGDVLWTLGRTGNFTMTGTTDPWPWFSHQHNVMYQLNGTSVIALFDNGNTRIASNPSEVSRGQVLNIDEDDFTVSLQINVNMPGFSPALGSAQRLDNGNYHFEAGWLSPQSNPYGEAIEVLPAGTYNFELIDVSLTYRGYRMDSLYELDAPGN